MSVVVPGKPGGGNLTEPLSLTIRNWAATNWPDSTALVKASQIKFRNLWWDGYGSYQIHFLDRSVNRAPMVLGWQYEYAFDYVDAHIFVRKNTRTRPPELDDIKRSLESIIMINRTNMPVIGPVGGYMRVMRTVDLPVRDAVTDVWMAVVQIEIRYFLATTT
jgi:hypothetical protein